VLFHQVICCWCKTGPGEIMAEWSGTVPVIFPLELGSPQRDYKLFFGCDVASQDWSLVCCLA